MREASDKVRDKARSDYHTTKDLNSKLSATNRDLLMYKNKYLSKTDTEAMNLVELKEDEGKSLESKLDIFYSTSLLLNKQKNGFLRNYERKKKECNSLHENLLNLQSEHSLLLTKCV